MADECQHSSFLETTLKQCHDGSPLMVGTHESYLKIIEDLKNDLDEISCEVVMVQKECNDQDQSRETDDVGLESSIRELERQNDRLEQALKLQTQTKEAALMELQTNNESLKCQIAQLQRMIIEKDQFIHHLHKRFSHIQSSEPPHHAALEYVTVGNNFTAELERKIETLSEKLDKSRKQEQFLSRETRKLNMELNESRKKNRDLVTQAHRVSGLLKCQENNCVELAAKYEAMEQNYEDQAKRLRAANNQLSMLDERFQTMEKRQIDHNTERNMLREEVLSLKEKHACAIGRQKSIQEQLLKTEKELYTAHDVIKEQKAIMQRNDCIHNEAQRRLQETNVEIKRKLTDLIKDHQKLQQEHEKQKEINAQQLKILENFRKWREQQLRAEQTTRESFTMYQDFIRDMFEEKKKLLYNFHELSKEYSLLQNEMERLKMCPLSLPNLNNLNASERSIADRLEIIRHTTRRVIEQNSSFKDEEPSASRDELSSACRPSEEPL